MAAELGARYVGVVFAEGRRQLTAEHATEVLSAAVSSRGRPQRVGVFGHTTPDDIARTAEVVELDAVQLHGDPDGAMVASVRSAFDGEIWAVLRVSDRLPQLAEELFTLADAVVLDHFSRTSLGGTGESFDWGGVSDAVPRGRAAAQIVLAGGLRAENVAEAVRLLHPDVVDVASGVESAPGVKDHSRMRVFAETVAAL
jgi:phosphoribosylanthranilate isomerase